MTDTTQRDDPQEVDPQALLAPAREAYERDRPPEHLRARMVARYAAERANGAVPSAPVFARWGYVTAGVVALLALSNIWFADAPDDPVTLATVARLQLPELPSRPALPNHIFLHRTAVPELIGLTTPRVPTKHATDSSGTSEFDDAVLNDPVLNEVHNEDC